jgi:MFS family permease
MPTRLQFLLLNIGHFLDHLFMLVFATVAALVLANEWGMSYAALIPYATPGFVAFGLFAVPAGWLADRWSRHLMMIVFFIGIGLCSVATSFAGTPLQIGIGLFFIGVFAAIYHPVGIALVLDGPGKKGMRIAVNGVWGNLGVAVAALLTGFLIDAVGWRAAFVAPGLLSLVLGFVYWWTVQNSRKHGPAVEKERKKLPAKSYLAPGSVMFLRVLAVVFGTTALGGLVFQSTTFALPKVLAERAADKESAAAFIGVLAFAAFAIGSMGQLVVGYLLDRISPKRIFMMVAALQVVFFALAVSAYGTLAIAAAVGYMIAAFGQIPINDILIGRISSPELRSRLLAIRYSITILVMATTVPVIAWIHANYGFDFLFKVLMTTSLAIFGLVYTLPMAVVDPEKSAEQSASPA